LYKIRAPTKIRLIFRRGVHKSFVLKSNLGLPRGIVSHSFQETLYIFRIKLSINPFRKIQQSPHPHPSHVNLIFSYPLFSLNTLTPFLSEHQTGIIHNLYRIPTVFTTPLNTQ
jgi:hypothetical protein